MMIKTTTHYAIALLFLCLSAPSFCAEKRRKLDEGDVGDFVVACERDNLQKAQALLQKNPGLVTARSDVSRASLLFDARSASMARLLLESKADINDRTPLGGTMLHRASSREDLELISLLIAYKASVNTVTTLGETPLHKATGLWHNTKWKGHVPTARLLIAHKAALDAKGTPEEHTALHSAVLRNDEPMVALLLRANADMTISNKEGRAPLWELFKSREQRPNAIITQLFIAAGYNPVPFGVDMVSCVLSNHDMCNRWSDDSKTVCMSEKAALYYKARADVEQLVAVHISGVHKELDAVLPQSIRALQSTIVSYYPTRDFVFAGLANEVLNKDEQVRKRREEMRKKRQELNKK